MAIIDDSLIINPDLPLIGTGSLAGVWDAEMEAHNNKVNWDGVETLSGLEDYCDDPPSNPEKLSSWVNHEHETTFLWNISISYSGLTPVSSRYYSIAIYDPDGKAVATLEEVYGVFPTQITQKFKPAMGTWTFKLMERASSAITASQKASTTKYIAVMANATSLNTTITFTT